jgi:hypothetical protein
MSVSMKPARARRQRVDRRKFPRIPLSVPVRYATETGDVGIGVLVDVTVEGAGLVVPHIQRDALHVWLQFLWFDDNVGLQGRVTHVRETSDGYHLGIHLQLVSRRSVEFISNLLIPYGLKKFRHDRRRVRTLAQALLAPAAGRARRVFPVLVAQGPILEWAITEYRDDTRAVLLTPRLPRENTPLVLTSWGRSGVYRATVLESEPLPCGAVTLYRVMVRYARVQDRAASAKGRAVGGGLRAATVLHPATA